MTLVYLTPLDDMKISKLTKQVAEIYWIEIFKPKNLKSAFILA